VAVISPRGGQGAGTGTARGSSPPWLAPSPAHTPCTAPSHRNHACRYALTFKPIGPSTAPSYDGWFSQASIIGAVVGTFLVTIAITVGVMVCICCHYTRGKRTDDVRKLHAPPTPIMTASGEGGGSIPTEGGITPVDHVRGAKAAHRLPPV